MLVKELLQTIEKKLLDAKIESALFEAKLLVSHFINCKFSQLIMHLNDELADNLFETIMLATLERCDGRPVQYILGETEFFGLRLLVGEGVLIPRHETEILVEQAILNYPASNLGILDLCTGSGAIIIALQHELSKVNNFAAIDISDLALDYTKRNISLHSAEDRIKLYKGDLFAPLPEKSKFSMIVTNPPYVTEDEYLSLDRTVKDFEPKLALTASDNGLAIIKKIAAESANFLAEDGVLICEIGCFQAVGASDCFKPYFQEVTIIKDYTNRDRFVFAKIPLKK